MDEQFIDRVINILIEQEKKGFMPNPLRGTPSREMMRNVRASRIANIRGKRLLTKLGAGKEEPKKEEPKINDSKFIDRVINILVEMRLDETPKSQKHLSPTQRSDLRDEMARGDKDLHPDPHNPQPHKNMFVKRQERHEGTAETYDPKKAHGSWGPGHMAAKRARNERIAQARAQAKREDSSTQLIANKITEGNRSKKLARAKNPNKIKKLKASQERGDSQRALKAGKGGEDALNRMFGIGKKGS